MSLDQVYHELLLIRSDIKDLRHDLTKYKGFVHGVLWCLAALASVLGVLGLV